MFWKSAVARKDYTISA